MSLLFLFLALFVGINIRYSLVLGLIEAVLLLGFVIYRFSKKTASISLLFILLGVGLSFIRFDFQKQIYKSVVVEVKDNYMIVSSSFERLYVYEKELRYEIGDIVSIEGYKKDLEFSTTESSFDFKDYLNKKGVYKQLIVKKIEVNFKTPLRVQSLKKKFLSHFDDETSGLIKQLLFGMNDSGETNSLLREMHLIRISSTSGLFINLLFTFIVYIFIRIIKKEKYADLIGVVFLLVYSVFTFPRFVVIKYVFLFILKWINKYLLKGRFSYLEIISFTGIVFLLLNYHYAYQDSFLLAYYLPILILFANGSFRIKGSWKKRGLIILIINIAMIPFILNFNYELSPLSIIFQLLLSPLLVVYYLFSLISFIGIPIYPVMNGFTWFLNKTLSFLSPLLFKINAPPLPPIGVFIYSILFIAVLYFMSIKNKDIYKWLTLGFFVISTMYFLPIKERIYSSISFINVGQGDSCLIQSGNTTVMIDTGGNKYTDLAKESLIPYLKKNRIYDIDLLITTHDDFDHSGAASSLTHNFKVKRYVKDYQNFPINVGNLTLTNYNVYPSLWSEENDASLVIGFTIKDYEFLIMGDAPKKIEEKIIKDNPNLKCDVLKVGHHGSNTSSSETFIKAVSPKVAIISCGKDNKYGHPHKIVLSILNKYKVKIKRTDLEGTIKFSL